MSDDLDRAHVEKLMKMNLPDVPEESESVAATDLTRSRNVGSRPFTGGGRVPMTGTRTEKDPSAPVMSQQSDEIAIDAVGDEQTALREEEQASSWVGEPAHVGP
jgi:hypothetical protein